MFCFIHNNLFTLLFIKSFVLKNHYSWFVFFIIFYSLVLLRVSLKNHYCLMICFLYYLWYTSLFSKVFWEFLLFKNLFSLLAFILPSLILFSFVLKDSLAFTPGCLEAQCCIWVVPWCWADAFFFSLLLWFLGTFASLFYSFRFVTPMHYWSFCH